MLNQWFSSELYVIIICNFCVTGHDLVQRLLWPSLTISLNRQKKKKKNSSKCMKYIIMNLNYFDFLSRITETNELSRIVSLIHRSIKASSVRTSSVQQFSGGFDLPRSIFAPPSMLPRCWRRTAHATPSFRLITPGYEMQSQLSPLKVFPWTARNTGDLVITPLVQQKKKRRRKVSYCSFAAGWMQGGTGG